jgi:integrase
MEDLPKIPNLHLRKGKYYFRTRVPKDIVAVLGKKEIKITLETSDYREAKQALPNKQVKANEMFSIARRELNKAPPQQQLAIVGRADIERRIILWHQQEVDKHAKEDDTLRVDASQDDISITIDSLREDLSAFDGGNESQYASGIQGTVKSLFGELDTQTPEFRLAQTLIHQSIIEQTYKRLERYGDIYKRVPFQLFLTRKATFIETTNTPASRMTWLTLIAKFKKARKSDGLTDKTLAGYKLAFDFSTELFGKEKIIEAINAVDCRTFRDKLKELPSNAKKRYPNLSLINSIKAHSKNPTATLSITSINGNTNKLSAIFNFAVQEGLLDKNPCEHIPRLKQRKKKADSRQPFSEVALQKLFQAPIYTGCIDDEWKYKASGANKPKRHKFWIPLIALYTGMRLNEICQLFAYDVAIIEGINVIQVQIDDNQEKSLKNTTSERRIPIHNQLIKIGFIDYVDQMKSKGHKRLFPDLPQSSSGSYSDNFSKWFTRFLISINIKRDGACFHSFRHNFRDALREAGIPKEMGAALGGWKSSEDVMDEYGRGYRLPTLNKSVQQIYFDCDLKHLYHPKEH